MSGSSGSEDEGPAVHSSPAVPSSPVGKGDAAPAPSLGKGRKRLHSSTPSSIKVICTYANYLFKYLFCVSICLIIEIACWCA